MTRHGGDNTPDRILLARALEDPDSEGSKRAASRLLRRYHRQVYRWCFAMLRDEDLAKDVAQQALLAAYRKLDTFGDRARFSSWLFAIMRNHCLTHLRRPGLLRDETDAALRLEDKGAAPDAALEERQSEENLRGLLKRHLANDEQDALWLRSMERMPIDEITRTLNLTSASGARGVLQSARRKLRNVLERDPKARRELGHE